MACQEEEEENDEEEEAEFDAMLIESAGDVIPVMAKLVGGENFLSFLGGFLPDLLKRMVNRDALMKLVYPLVVRGLSPLPPGRRLLPVASCTNRNQVKISYCGTTVIFIVLLIISLNTWHLSFGIEPIFSA